MTITTVLIITFLVQVSQNFNIKEDKKKGVKNASITRSVATEKPKDKK